MSSSEHKNVILKANRLNETLPNPDSVIPSLPTDRPIRVYVEYSFIRSHLQSPRFEQVENPDDAEILWLSSHFKDYKCAYKLVI